MKSTRAVRWVRADRVIRQTLRFVRGTMGGALLPLLLGGENQVGGARAARPPVSWFEIRCLDAETGRGVPLVELETVNHLRFVTDNLGRVAFAEPGLAGREIFFHVRSHGYALPADGFGYRGVRLTPQPGGRGEIRLKRVNIAERLYRVTGEGRYRDSLLLGYDAPADEPRTTGLVAGQDSVQATPYRGRIHWFWGDTDRMGYPLGHFRTSGATSPLPAAAKSRVEDGLDLSYSVGPDGFSRPMIPLPERPDGVIWIDGLVVVPNERGEDQLVCHYSRRKGLAEQLEHGLAKFSDARGIFEPLCKLPESETWRFLQGHATLVEEGGLRWVYCGFGVLHVRVPARFEAVVDPARYEAFTCLYGGDEPGKRAPRRQGGVVEWSWRSDAAPCSPEQEARWLKSGELQAAEPRFSPRAAVGDERPVLHGGTVRWNRFRGRWILIAVQTGGRASHLGEVWYAEARTPVGPFERAVKILTHDRQSFYNPCHHDFLDEEGGRFIYFEGTYVNTFSGNPETTPRYNYNQIMYRLDLADERLRAAP